MFKKRETDTLQRQSFTLYQVRLKETAESNKACVRKVCKTPVRKLMTRPLSNINKLQM